MQSKIVRFPLAGADAKNPPINQLTPSNYAEAEQQFIQLLEEEDLDKKLGTLSSILRIIDRAIASAIGEAYERESGCDAAHLFLQRVLYRINRLKLFWYDDLRRYTNERSTYLRTVRDEIETAWQQWELTQIDLAEGASAGVLTVAEVKQALNDRSRADLEPPTSANGRFFRECVTEAGYRRLLAIASLDGLVEASQLSRTLGGVGNEIQSVLTRLFVEEYGGGRLARKHSSYFTEMLAALDMQTQPEAYFDIVPWEVLATINYSFLLSERKRYFLRYIGGLLYFEVSVPAGFSNYRAAAQRLGLPPAAMSYWDIHIKVDIQHGRWMLDEVALPLAEQYPADGWELVFGYDQQRFMSDRAGAAVARSVREAEQTESSWFKALKKTEE